MEVYCFHCKRPPSPCSSRPSPASVGGFSCSGAAPAAIDCTPHRPSQDKGPLMQCLVADLEVSGFHCTRPPSPNFSGPFPASVGGFSCYGAEKTAIDCTPHRPFHDDGPLTQCLVADLEVYGFHCTRPPSPSSPRPSHSSVGGFSCFGTPAATDSTSNRPFHDQSWLLQHRQRPGGGSMLCPHSLTV